MGTATRNEMSWRLPAAAIVLTAPSARAVSYAPCTDLYISFHGFDEEGYTRVGAFSGDELDTGVFEEASLQLEELDSFFTFDGVMASHFGFNKDMGTRTAPLTVAGTPFLSSGTAQIHLTTSTRYVN